jgi:hypothetical protein
MDKVKFTVEVTTDKFCGECSCLGLSGKEEEYCGYFNQTLKLLKGKALKCGECKLMVKILANEAR